MEGGQHSQQSRKKLINLNGVNDAPFASRTARLQHHYWRPISARHHDAAWKANVAMPSTKYAKIPI